jgi:hypothetical protein
MRKVTDKEDAHVLRKAKGEGLRATSENTGVKDYGLRGKEQVEVEIKVKIEKKMDSRLRGNDERREQKEGTKEIGIGVRSQHLTFITLNDLLNYESKFKC